jgi:hypothetical protein
MPVQPNENRSGATPAALLVIRASLFAGVLMFGAVTWYLHSKPTRPDSTPDPETLAWVVLGAWAVITAGLVVLSTRYRRPAARERRVNLAIIGWALGEAAALIGGVHYFLTGDPQRYGFGVLIFVIALVMFPIPPLDGPRAMR